MLYSGKLLGPELKGILRCVSTERKVWYLKSIGRSQQSGCDQSMSEHVSWILIDETLRIGKIRMPLKRITKGGTDMRVGLTEFEEGAEMAITDYYTLAFAGDLVSGCIM